jgi:hypothetical protein
MANETDSTGFSFDNVFSKAAGLATDFGSAYLTLKGQEKIAVETAEAQARLNKYSAVNPSLGPVNPAAAQRQANQSPVQNWLPWGSPIAGTNSTTASATANPTGKILVFVAIAAGVLIVWKLLRK